MPSARKVDEEGNAQSTESIRRKGGRRDQGLADGDEEQDSSDMASGRFDMILHVTADTFHCCRVMIFCFLCHFRLRYLIFLPIHLRCPEPKL